MALPGAAFAEKSDRDKPVNIEADRVTVDDKKKESVFDGNVTMTQGTLMLKADKVVVTQDAGGFNHAVAYGKPAYFKQKREGYDEYIEGTAERLEYDGKADKMQMFVNAEVHKGNDEVKGDYISYDANTEFYQVIAGDSVKTVSNPKGRVHATIQPPKKAGDGKPAGEGTAPQPVPLKPSGSLRNKLEE
ncbi:MAG TPA: lipopolysaccharide transport periplasmic protein LptA [Burkholderiales bacterium]|nr:lipopolysaccharide transport periplasmic protein LptA [Burkholderiales bacterium]